MASCINPFSLDPANSEGCSPSACRRPLRRFHDCVPNLSQLDPNRPNPTSSAMRPHLGERPWGYRGCQPPLTLWSFRFGNIARVRASCEPGRRDALSTGSWLRAWRRRRRGRLSSGVAKVREFSGLPSPPRARLSTSSSQGIPCSLVGPVQAGTAQAATSSGAPVVCSQSPTDTVLRWERPSSVLSADSALSPIRSGRHTRHKSQLDAA